MSLLVVFYDRKLRYFIISCLESPTNTQNSIHVKIMNTDYLLEVDMMTNIRLQLAQKQQVKLLITPEFRQNIHLLQLSVQELTQHIQEQLAENPLLELDEHDESFKTDSIETHHPTNKETSWENIANEQISLATHLEEQLRFLSLTPTKQKICNYLIGNLNEHGYLTIDVSTLCKALHTKEAQIKNAIAIIQSLEPIGVGARSFTECIELQLRNQKKPNQLSICIARNHLQEIAMGKTQQVAEELGVTVEEVQHAVDLIKQCNPYPCANFMTNPPQYIYPDVTVKRIDHSLHISLHRDGLDRLQITPRYDLFLQHVKRQPELADHLKNWYRSAQWLIKGISQRQHTIYRLTKAIVAKQHDFFCKGAEYLKPLTRQQIAEELALHESTISRATKNKYMQTPHGIFPFSYFFPTGVSDQITSSQIKQKIQTLINQESRKTPLSDQKLVDCLKMEGIRISRRTVTKYRKELGIASSTIRKHLP